MSIQAFVDNGYSQGSEYCRQFLSSPEFKQKTLLSILGYPLTRSNKKIELSQKITESLEKKQISDNEVLLAYVKQPRMWLSLKTGEHSQIPRLMPPAQLLDQFGEEGWYGPIVDSNSPRIWYIRTHKVINRLGDTGEIRPIEGSYIRWSVIAEIDDNYVAFSWNNFSFTEQEKEHCTPSQFPFWLYVPKFFDELSQHCQSSWEHPILHELILNQVWNQYLQDTNNYRWQHLRIRAEASGVALNAHSAGISEINVKGLQALSRKLAESALETLDFPDLTQCNRVENAILHTLIKEWGTKSYEFSLEKVPAQHQKLEAESSTKPPELDKLFKAHCYFGLKSDSRTQDAFQHLRCYDSGYGGSTLALDFVLRELGLRG
jgi:hypothetical protein